jgi:DNA invertase Pin-like site-specific DNA recombinase
MVALLAWTEDPGELGELLFAIAGWVARMESQRRSERTKTGLARARAHGKILGGQVSLVNRVV